MVDKSKFPYRFESWPIYNVLGGSEWGDVIYVLNQVSEEVLDFEVVSKGGIE